jgi:hypothetical protein
MEVTRGCVGSFISRHCAELIEKKSLPQEEPRLQVPRVFLDQTVHSMHDAVQGRPADVVFNLDEVGISDWDDRQCMKVTVPITATPHSIHPFNDSATSTGGSVVCTTLRGNDQ